MDSIEAYATGFLRRPVYDDYSAGFYECDAVDLKIFRKIISDRSKRKSRSRWNEMMGDDEVDGQGKRKPFEGD